MTFPFHSLERSTTDSLAWLVWHSVTIRQSRQRYWYLDSNEEVSPFRGSANADYKMSGADRRALLVHAGALPCQEILSLSPPEIEGGMENLKIS
jgi:hypothetical protein